MGKASRAVCPFGPLRRLQRVAAGMEAHREAPRCVKPRPQQAKTQTQTHTHTHMQEQNIDQRSWMSDIKYQYLAQTDKAANHEQTHAKETPTRAHTHTPSLLPRASTYTQIARRQLSLPNKCTHTHTLEKIKGLGRFRQRLSSDLFIIHKPLGDRGL